MLHLFKKKPSAGSRVTFRIDGMHCTSCSMNIDDALEETEGVITAETSYAKGKTIIQYNPATVRLEKLKKVIKSLDYEVTELP